MYDSNGEIDSLLGGIDGIDGIRPKFGGSPSRAAAELQTAEQSLNIIEKVHKIIDSNDSPESAPLLGVRDLGRLRTLLSIIVRWGLEPLLDRVISAWPERPNRATSDSIIDLTSTPEDYSRLSSFVLRLHALIFPSGLQGKPSQSLITETILQRHSKDILAPSIALGWLPKSMSSESMFPLDSVRPLTMRLLLMLPSSQTIASLGGVMSTRSSVAHIRKTCGYLLSRQLLRPDGVRGLFGAVFGEAEGEEVTLKQLEHVSQVLTAIPANMKGQLFTPLQNYFEDIVPKVVNIVHDDKRLAYKRASAFTLSRLLAGNDETPRTIILSTLHSPFLQPESNSTTTAATAVSTLSSLLANSDPSPELITSLLSPIVPPLYALLYHLESVKISDPTIREAVRDMLLTWSRVMTKSEAVAVLWFILNDQDGKLKVGLDGMIQKTEKYVSHVAVGLSHSMTCFPRFDENLSLFTPESLRQAEESGQLEAGANFLDLYPDPSHYASFIQLINRQDILSDIFVMLLEAYRESKLSNGDPIQLSVTTDCIPAQTFTIWFQGPKVIMQLQATMSHSSSKLGGFQNSAQVLEFIRQVLDDSARGSGSSEKRRSKNVESDVSSLRVVDHPVAEEEGEDSDDDLEDSEKRDIDTEMTETALTILLSILEGEYSQHIYSTSATDL
ncbi:hypothetical protein WG66_005156 [Moniliophthora roreri]|nr:hypothetical protein WG66_005156 [Moniliophthora roreri]